MKDQPRCIILVYVPAWRNNPILAIGVWHHGVNIFTTLPKKCSDKARISDGNSQPSNSVWAFVGILKYVNALNLFNKTLNIWRLLVKCLVECFFCHLSLVCVPWIITIFQSVMHFKVFREYHFFIKKVFEGLSANDTFQMVSIDFFKTFSHH